MFCAACFNLQDASSLLSRLLQNTGSLDTLKLSGLCSCASYCMISCLCALMFVCRAPCPPFCLGVHGFVKGLPGQLSRDNEFLFLALLLVSTDSGSPPPYSVSRDLHRASSQLAQCIKIFKIFHRDCNSTVPCDTSLYMVCHLNPTLDTVAASSLFFLVF